MFFVFGREEKCVKDIQIESRTDRDPFFYFLFFIIFYFFESKGCLGPFIASTRFSRR